MNSLRSILRLLLADWETEIQNRKWKHNLNRL